MSRRVPVTFGLVLLFVVMVTPSAHAYKGLAAGKVGLIDSSVRGYGFSSNSGLWSTTSLDSPALSRMAGQYLGYLRTSGRLYCYNSINDHWFYIAYTGIPKGEDIRGATAIVWTTSNMYAIASVWALWRTLAFNLDEAVRGGGSAGNFGLVWTTRRAYAFNSGSGQWIMQDLGGYSAVGGIASEGLGLVWTSHDAFCFSPGVVSWSTLPLGAPQGVSAAGSGSVGAVWGNDQALAFSGILNSWTPLDGPERFLGGAAGGEVAILWDTSHAHCFNAATGQWSSVALDVMEPDKAGGEFDESGFSVEPNPSRGLFILHLPSSEAWKIQIVDVTGAQVRSLEVAAGSAPGGLAWDGLDTAGLRVAAGVYWIRAESESHQVEARRLVLVH